VSVAAVIQVYEVGVVPRLQALATAVDLVQWTWREQQQLMVSCQWQPDRCAAQEVQLSTA